MNANRLFWLGRYEQRVAMTLHQLRKCCDGMIDGQPTDYAEIWNRLDASGNYSSSEEFTLGMMYDEENPSSVISAQIAAQDNAMLLRGSLATETLAYLEMSVALMRDMKKQKQTNVTMLQPVTDWALAFWGSAEERVEHHRMMLLMHIGRKIETIDMLIRFDYPFVRLANPYNVMKRFLKDIPDICDEHILAKLDELMTQSKYDVTDQEYKCKLIKLINLLIRV